MNASSSLAKRAAAVAASGWTKLLVRKSASEFSPQALARQALAHRQRVEPQPWRQIDARDLRSAHQAGSAALCNVRVVRSPDDSSSSPWPLRAAAIAASSSALPPPAT